MCRTNVAFALFLGWLRSGTKVSVFPKPRYAFCSIDHARRALSAHRCDNSAIDRLFCRNAKLRPSHSASGLYLSKCVAFK